MRSVLGIEALTRRVLQESEIRGPKVDVHKIARDKGAVVKEEDFEDGVSGALYQNESAVIIGVNSADSKNRQRFTVAHEIGHLVLGHQRDLFVDQHYVGPVAQAAAAPNIQRIHRDTISSQATNPLEIEANRFAAALLMPRHFLDAALAGKNGPVRSELVKELAELFGVSIQAMTFRLMNLGVPLDPA